MERLQDFFHSNRDRRIFVVYKNSSVGDLSLIHRYCRENGKILTILMPKVNQYPTDVMDILMSDNSSRIYEVTNQGMLTTLRKRGEQYVRQIPGSILVPDEFLIAQKNSG